MIYLHRPQNRDLADNIEAGLKKLVAACQVVVENDLAVSPELPAIHDNGKVVTGGIISRRLHPASRHWLADIIRGYSCADDSTKAEREEIPGEAWMSCEKSSLRTSKESLRMKYWGRKR